MKNRILLLDLVFGIDVNDLKTRMFQLIFHNRTVADNIIQVSYWFVIGFFPLQKLHLLSALVCHTEGKLLQPYKIKKVV